MSILSAPPVSPFKGLAAFGDSELDALFFFGREREREVIVANLLASRLTVLYGESGVGKSSLLAAAVVRDLREAAPDAPIVLRTTWSGELGDIGADFDGGAEGYLILDQFEEYFLYHADGGAGTLLAELPELLATTRVNVLIALREDNLARLDAFKARIPGVFANQLRLEHLDAEQARRAILGPLARWDELTGEHVDAEPALVEAVVDDVAVDGGRVEAPYLQLVLERVWAAERDAGSWLLRRATLDRLGGAAAIVREQFRGALDALPPDEQDVAAAVFEHLVTPSGTKIAHGAGDLAEYAGVEESTLRRVLARLTRERIVHSVEGSDRYEIFHDVLAEPVSSWRLQRRLERERAAARRRQRRLYGVVVLALLALAVVAALAIWALNERGTARNQAHHARARELEATALQQLPIDPNRSLRGALAAARLESGPRVEDVLRQALVADRLRLVRREAAPITGVAVSPTADRVAVAVPGVGVELRSEDGRVVHRLAAQSVRDVAFSADGREVVGAAANGAAVHWLVRDGSRIGGRQPLLAARLPSGRFALVRAHGDLARVRRRSQHVVATPGGKLIAASVLYPNGRKRVWVFNRRGRRVRVLPQIGIQALGFSPDGRVLAVATAPEFTYLWNTRTWKLARPPLSDSKQGANVLAFSPDGTFLATGGADSGVRVWTLATGERTFFLFAHTNPVESLAWSPDSRVLASGSLDTTIRLWRVQRMVGAGSLAATLPGDTDTVTALAFTPDGTRLVSGSLDRSLRWWLATPDEQLRLLGRGPGSAVAAQWAGSTIAAAWSGGVVKTWDGRDTRRPAHVFTSGGSGYSQLAVSNDGSVIAAGRSDGRVDVWSADGRTLAPGSLLGRVVAVALAGRGALAAAADARGRVVMWDTSSGQVRAHVSTQPPIAALTFSRRGDVLAVSGRDGTSLLASADGRTLHDLATPGGDARAAFSPDGRYVATAGRDHNAHIWFAGTGRPYRTLRGHSEPLTDIAFSPNGDLLVTAAADADVRVWRVSRGLGHSLERRAFGSVPDVDFDRTGRWVVAAAPISAVVWQTGGRALFYLRGHGPLLTSASFAPDAQTVLTSSQDGTVRTYDCVVCVDLPALVALAEKRLAASG